MSLAAAPPDRALLERLLEEEDVARDDVPGIGVLGDFWLGRLDDWLMAAFGSSGWLEPLSRFLLLGLGIVLSVLLVMLLFRWGPRWLRGRSVFRATRRRRVQGTPLPAPPPALSLAGVEEALGAGRGSEALRCLWEIAAQALDRRGLAGFEPSATNREFVEEVRRQSPAFSALPDLERLCRHVDRCRYGGHEVSADEVRRFVPLVEGWLP